MLKTNADIPELAFVQPYAYMVFSGDDGSGLPYGNEMACVVVDAQEQRVVYYCKQTPTFASHPKDNEDVSKLLHKLLKDFIR